MGCVLNGLFWKKKKDMSDDLGLAHVGSIDCLFVEQTQHAFFGYRTSCISSGFAPYTVYGFPYTSSFPQFPILK